MRELTKYSFDVFDTVLTRTVSHPSDVFRFVQKRIQTHDELPNDLRKKFYSARIWAEFICRRLTSAEDVSLQKIYELLEREYRLKPSNTAKLMAEELEIEAICLVPIEPVINIIDRLHEEGHHIIFASDMYLPEEFIREKLQAYGAFRSGDRLYVSGELGFTKGSGGLFKYILDQEGLAPEQLLHCGDNQHSDVIVPAKMRIRLYPEGRKLCLVDVGLFPRLRARVRYGISLMRARWDLGVFNVV